MGYLTNIYDDIVTQLEWHVNTANTGALLTDAYFYKNPLERTDGRSSFPNIQIWIPNIEETNIDQKSIQSNVQIGLAVSVFNDQRNECGVRDLLDLIERVLDALYVATDGTTKTICGLGGVPRQQIQISATETDVTETSISVFITLAFPVAAAFGNRRLAI